MNFNKWVCRPFLIETLVLHLTLNLSNSRLTFNLLMAFLETILKLTASIYTRGLNVKDA